MPDFEPFYHRLVDCTCLHDPIEHDSEGCLESGCWCEGHWVDDGDGDGEDE